MVLELPPVAEAPPVAELTPDHPARVHDITSLATKSGLDLGDLSRQGRLLGVLTRAASGLVSSGSADALLDTLLAHLLDAIPAQRGAVAMLDDDGPLTPTVVATRPGEEETPMEIDRAVADRVPIPVIASGGVGNLEHIYEAFQYGHANAALAASIFHYRIHTIEQVKAYLKQKDIHVRTS